MSHLRLVRPDETPPAPLAPGHVEFLDPDVAMPLVNTVMDFLRAAVATAEPQSEQKVDGNLTPLR